jgi:hypothetical protein
MITETRCIANEHTGGVVGVGGVVCGEEPTTKHLHPTPEGNVIGVTPLGDYHSPPMSDSVMVWGVGGNAIELGGEW